MRTQQEMFDLILGVAQKDERIRAVYMNGSRTNPNVPKDIFQDYDIVYVVQQNKPFYEDKSWIDCFGERLYMQCPDEVDRWNGLPVDFDACYGWLIQFKDGNRMDLHVVPCEKADVLSDKLGVILLDKDGILPAIGEPTDRDYWVQKPSEPEFLACCNEFWWCLNNLAKGMWRKECLYVHQIFYGICQPELIKMLDWKAGNDNSFSISTGKASKYLNRYLPKTLWDRLLETFIGADIDKAWDSVFILCELFDDTARELSEKWGYQYNEEEAHASYSFLKQVHTLPEDAKSIF